jgi:ABC-2 type transport system ATP-binding protein
MSGTLPVALEAAVTCAVATEALSKRYARDEALRGVSLQVPEGAVYVLAGPNGAGKSTLFKVLMDLVRPTSGRAQVMGLDPRERGPLARACIGYVPERTDWGHEWMRVDRMLEHHASFFPAWDRAYATRLAKQFELRLDRKLGSLSKGQRRRVHLTMALAHRPPVLLLDEPTEGLDPVMHDDTLGLLADHLAETPTTALISTHRIHEVDRLADHVGVIRDGRLLLQATRDEVHRRLRRYRVQTPDGWSGAIGLNGAVVGRSGFGREQHWVVWGDESEVSARLAATGAAVHEAAPLTLEEATLALLRKESRE